MATFAFLLALVGAVLLFCAACGATFGRVSPGWLGAGLIAVAWLIPAFAAL